MDALQFDRIAKAFADPSRRRILEIVAAKPGVSCGEIVSEMASISQPTVSHHLKELKEAELVTCEAVGQTGRLTAVSATTEEYLAQVRKNLGL